MNLAELAVKNMRTQYQNFVMYFISMAFGVMVFYSFVAMSYNQALLERMAVSLNLSSSLKAGSTMIIIFIFVFMYTANNFFMQRRKKEIGLYNLLGMRKRQIGLLFFMENILIGLLALVVGIIAGVIFSKLFSMLLVKAMFLTVDSDFSISWRAIRDTAWMFLLILAVVSFRSGHLVYRYKLVDLFRGNSSQPKEARVTLWTWLMGLSGLGLLSYGYYLATHFLDFILKLNQQLQTDLGLIIGAMLLLLYCISGTYLFFWGFLQIAVKGLQMVKRYYYRDINMVSTGSLRYHFKKNGTTLATIAVLSGTAIAAIGGATNVYNFGMANVNAEIPTDYIVTKESLPAVKDVISQSENHQLAAETEVSFGVTGGYFERAGFGESQTYIGGVNILKISDYQKLTKISPLLPQLVLKKLSEVAVLEQSMANGEVVKRLTVKNLKFSGSTKKFISINNDVDALGGSFSTRYHLPTIVIQDELFKELSPAVVYQLSYLSITNGEDSQGLYEQLMREVPQKNYQITTEYTLNEDQLSGKMTPEVLLSEGNEEASQEGVTVSRQSLMARYPTLSASRVELGLLVYIAIFLGVVFLIATGSIVMLKQLSEAEAEKERYQTLRKIGVSREQIKRSVYRQNLFVFLAPLVIAYFHAKYALVTMSFLLASHDTLLTWFARGMLLLIYLGFYIGTAKTYNRLVNE